MTAWFLWQNSFSILQLRNHAENVLHAGSATNGFMNCSDIYTKGKGTLADLDRLKNMSLVIKDTSLCGLGQSSPNPVLSTLDNFRDEYVAHVTDKEMSGRSMQATLWNILSLLKTVSDVQHVQEFVL